VEEPAELTNAMQEHDRRSLARVLTQIENGEAPEDLLHQLYAGTGRAARIGITGVPGAGKSTLVASLAAEVRRRGRTVGVLAVDPSSPFTRGAILGDRIRMQDLIRDPGVFIRSMASRGMQGGLAASAIDAVTALDAFGTDVILIETIGAGQDEVDVMRVAQTVVVVEIPGTGDDVQSLKAGILEIADIYVVNKADREGADTVASVLRQLISLGRHEAWSVPVLKTVATTGDGVPAVLDAIDSHQRYLVDSGALECKKREQARFQLLNLVQRRVLADLVKKWDESSLLDAAAEEVASGRMDPHQASRRLLEEGQSRS